MDLSHILFGVSLQDEYRYLSNFRRKIALPWVSISKQRETVFFCLFFSYPIIMGDGEA